MFNAAIQQEDGNPIVLIVDDSRDVHRLLKARLRSEGLEFLSADDGPSGVAIAAEKQPSLILLDLDMPGRDGFEVLRDLKDCKETLSIPVIVLSGMQSPQDKVTAFDLGAVDYVTKPFDLAELRARVRSALRLHSLVKLLAQRAQIDGLTGLWNRAYFDRRWAEEFSRHDRYGHPLSLAMLDIDHFKSINDTYGHPAGDAVLQAIGRVLPRETRVNDVSCRYGGEEFAIIMPDTPPTDAEVICNRLREVIRAVSWPRHPERTVTVSIGLCGSAERSSVGADQWIESADKALYAAKRSGRNRVVVHALDPVPMRLAG